MKDRHSWLSFARHVHDILRKNNIEHIFIKNFLHPYKFGDIDILVNGNNINKIDRIFLELDFNKVSPGYPSPLSKREFLKNGFLVEFYPKLSWRGIYVLDNDAAFKNTKYDIELGLPILLPEYEVYVIATHSFSHMMYSKEDIENCLYHISNSRKFNWDILYNLAEEYGTKVPLYFLLSALSIFYNYKIPEIFIDDLYRKIYKVCTKQKIPIIVPKKYRRIIFPVCHYRRIIHKLPKLSLEDVFLEIISLFF